MKKKIISFFCMIFCLLAIFAGSSRVLAAQSDFDEETMKSSMEEFINSWFVFDFAGTVENYGEQLEQEGIKEEYESYIEMQQKAGEKREFGDYDIQYDEEGNTATVKVVVTCDDIKLQFEADYDASMMMQKYTITEYKEEAAKEKTDLGAVMKKALMNTLMGIGIVFLVLIFISIVIGLFVFISKFQNRSKEKANGNAEVSTPRPVPQTVQTEVAPEDDLELIAVITAAIAAAEGNVSADDLIVRSIRRR